MANEPEVIKLTKEALDLLTTAVHFDKANSLVGACDFYDLAILNIDEVLNKLTAYSPEWNSLMSKRTMYDARLEYLRDLENSKFDFTNISLGLESESDNPKSPTRGTRKRRQSHVPFEDLHIETPIVIDNDKSNINDSKKIVYEAPPTSTIKISYWQLRVIANTIENGGYLTPNLYVPKNLWTQFGVKFSGLSAKTSAFQTIITNLNNHLSILDLPIIDENTVEDENAQLNLLQSLRNGHAALKSICEEFNNLQNQLSKPFPFIREIVRDDMALNSNSQKGQVSRITNMVSALSKNVRKYAEVGYQRLGTIPVRLSEEDFTAFTTLTSHLCDRCQLIDKWNDNIEMLRDLAIRKLRVNEGQIQTALISAIENCLGELHKISLFFRDVVCEMLLRDIETLLTRYLSKMRKSFSRMYWDDDLD